MKKKKFYCTHDKWLILIHALNDLRNRRIAEGKSVYIVDDTIVTVMAAKDKNIKIS